MSIVAGVDFGTLSVRVSIFDSVKGRLGAASSDYPLHRKKEDPDYATQSHPDHMAALAKANAPSDQAGAHPRRCNRSHRTRHDRLQRNPGGPAPEPHRRLLS